MTTAPAPRAVQHPDGERPALTLNTAEGPSLLHAARVDPLSNPPYAILWHHDPVHGQRYTAYEKRGSQWLMTATMLTRAEARNWAPCGASPVTAPAPETAAWPDQLTASAASRQPPPDTPPLPGPEIIFHSGSGPGTHPCMDISGVLVFAYIDAASATLTVSLDIDDASPELLDASGLVPLRIDIQGRTIFRAPVKSRPDPSPPVNQRYRKEPR